MSRLRRLIAGAVLLGLGLLAVRPPAAAGVLYKCEAPDGVVAYTNKANGYAKCSVLSRYADPPAPRRSAAAAPPPKPRAASVTTQRWVYEENAKPRPDFSAVRADVASTAARLGAAVAKAAPAAPRPAARVLRGSVYRVQRSDGIVEYTNVKPASGAYAVLFTYIATCVACDVHSAIDFGTTALNLDAYRAEIAAAAADFGLDSALLRAVIHAESAFNPLAVSKKGAQGLMQLMPDTANDLGVTDAFDVVQNIRGGARYLAELLRSFGGDEQLAAAAYNAGAGAVQKYGGVPPYDETQVYVQRVETLRDRYRKALL
ncbi:MAG TPA: lytic transglycosylase domain-containing protein [Dokdonella sp.]